MIQTSPIHPADRLLTLIAALLAPMFLCVCDGDIAMARMAASETVTAYRVRDLADLLAVAQVVAFGLAALGSLSRSMEDLPLPMVLRLHANANALNRSAEQNRRAVQQHQAHDPAPPPAPEPEPPEPPSDDVFLSQAAARMLAAEAQDRLRDPDQTVDPAPIQATASEMTGEKRYQAMWAIAMVKEAAEITASIPTLPEDERDSAMFRAAALSSAANQLLTSAPEPSPPD